MLSKRSKRVILVFFNQKGYTNTKYSLFIIKQNQIQIRLNHKYGPQQSHKPNKKTLSPTITEIHI